MGDQKYIKSLELKGFKIHFSKTNFDSEGYDLYINISKLDSFCKSIFSMSNSSGFYFTYDSFECINEGCKWDFDDFKLAAEFLGVEKLTEIE